MFAGLAAQFLQADAQGHAAAVANLVPGGLQQLPDEATAIRHRATIGIRTLVVFLQQELVAQVTHARVNINDVVACLTGPPGRRRLPPDHIPDVPRIHCAGALVPHETHMRGCPGDT